eukprot:105269-Karenia_brevis.AAC.1
MVREHSGATNGNRVVAKSLSLRRMHWHVPCAISHQRSAERMASALAAPPTAGAAFCCGTLAL